MPQRGGVQLGSVWLTRREVEVLGLIAERLSNPEIARRLFVSVLTVKNHVHRILEKLGAATRVDAVRTAQAGGLFRDASGYGCPLEGEV